MRLRIRFAGIALGTLALPLELAAQQSMEHMDDIVLVMAAFDELEIADAFGENDLAWDADIWAGTDLNRIWIKTEGEDSDGRDEAELQALYSRAILPFWDVQAGVRRVFEPGRERNWAVVAIRGIAPYHFDTEAELFIGEGGDTGLRVSSSYELFLTQRWIVEPEIEFLVNGYDDPRQGLGSGLSSAELAVRLRYEIRRELAPYVGFEWTRYFGDTRDYARLAADDTSELALVAGIRIWF